MRALTGCNPASCAVVGGDVAVVARVERLPNESGQMPAVFPFDSDSRC